MGAGGGTAYPSGGRGFFEASVVTALVDRATVQRADGQEVLQRSFQGSLPSFLAAFLQAGTVSDQEAEEIAQMLDDYRHSH